MMKNLKMKKMKMKNFPTDQNIELKMRIHCQNSVEF